jgi:hypothetical protein
MLAVVYTNDGYWVGADSVRSGDKHNQIVCKVHATNYGLLLKAGDITGTTENGVPGAPPYI